MRARRTLFVGLLALAAALTLAASPASAGKDASDLAARAAAWQKAFNAGDADAIAALYTEDGMRLPYEAPIVVGRAAVPANIQSTYDVGVTKIELEVLGAESQGNMAWGHGTYHLMDESGATVQKGKWMNVSKKIGGTWLIHCDGWNTDAPN
ncbi:MAG: DUF4440 domain-containing protein [Xanthomonadales bacterium]|nr:DUF4440 domain-containing protein [Xanthomonadales bacterium]